MDAIRTVKIPLKLNKREECILDKVIDCCRYVYNESLEYQITQWVEKTTIVSAYDAEKHLTEIKIQHPELEIAPRKCLDEAIVRATKAMANYHKKIRKEIKSGYPRYKGKNRYQSFSYKDKNDFIILSNSKIKLSKVGEIKFKGHINSLCKKSGIQRTCTIKKDGTGKWWATIVFLIKDYQDGTDIFHTKTPIGIDVNIENFATTSDGITYCNYKNTEHIHKNIQSIQKKMSKYEIGSVKWEKYRKQLAHAYKRQHNVEYDITHKISRKLVDNHSLIVFENLKQQKMIEKAKTKSLRRSLANIAWNRLFTNTEYKAEGAGIKIIKVNPAYTSRICSKCGSDVPKTLSQRTHICKKCGLIINRDINAAINILNRGLGCRPLLSKIT